MSTPQSTDPMVTKEGIRVEIGQWWRDLDTRMGNRVRKVVEIVDPVNGKVRVACNKGILKSVVSVRRMHRHSTGWELVR